MLPAARLNRIKELIFEKENMKISELSKELDVSEMTIHRDLKPLVEEGIIVKTFGGISLIHKKQEQPQTDTCILCNRANHIKMTYRLIFPGNKIEVACCAHCGLLRHRQFREEPIQAICLDFIRQTTINASMAWFVTDNSIDIGCCQPQVLTFEWEQHARKFVKGFGGNVYSFHEAMDVVFNKMNDHCCPRKQKG
ncbi:DeoR family transcriptional regulator [Virgibacillus sp. W0430]|uniref:DeoR family transcriptional regulator n=1 Tax=Virgibacillus sp. W0430 TaxID=3391580 RepID=UPI003F48A0DD